MEHTKCVFVPVETDGGFDELGKGLKPASHVLDESACS